MDKKIKALTLHQPWATLIAIGEKEYETRSWPTRYRGPLAIHAGKTCLYDERDGAFMGALREVGIEYPKRLPLGAVLCICELEAVYHTEDCAPYLDEREKLFGNFAPGRAAWKLRVIETFDPPIAAKGMQGLWEWIRP